MVYDTYKSEELLQALVKQLTSGTRQVTQVTSDTKLFEEGQLGSAPTGYFYFFFFKKTGVNNLLKG